MPSLHHTQTPSDPHDQVSDSNHSPISDTQIPSDLPDDDPSKKAGKWTSLEDDLLRKYVPVFGEKQWRKISEHIPGRTSIQCLHRWTKILKPGLVKGPWTAEEDQKLLSWVKAEGPAKWAQCANLIKGRSGKQCRERWSNNLNPNVKKGNWAKEEDELIFELYQKFGSSWSKIAKYIPGRTENAIKNRFYSTLRKLTADKKKDQPEKHEDLCLGEEEVQNEDSPAKNILDMGVPVQTPSALYQLLNTKTSAISPNEEMKEETCSDEKKLQQQQAFNINGEKVVVLRDIKPSEKKIKKAANKLVSDEVQENDAAFEAFLNSIQVDIKYNFVKTDKLNFSVKDNDTTHFDGLQNKIKGYCQTNIKDLAEGFKPLDTNKTSSTASEISTSDMKARSLVFPQRSASSVLPISNTQQECSNIRGTTIITPTPNKQAELFAKAPQMLSRAASSPLAPVFSPFSPFNNSSMFQPKLFNGNKMNVEQNWSLPLNKGFSQGFPLNNMTTMMQNSLSMSMPGSDQKMAMLFQQMYSLEVMLAKTRNELMNFEKHLKENEGKNFGGENMKVEDDHHIFVKPNMLGCRPFGNFTSEFEEVLKKRKVE